MSYRFDDEVLADRARDLEGEGLNGIDLVFVELEDATPPTFAELRLEFHNGLHLAAIDDAINIDGIAPTAIFTIRGGSRLPAGDGAGEVQVTQLLSASGNALTLRVEPVGDYSTYTLRVDFRSGAGDDLIDPLFAEIPFKFRPGCFNLNCAPTWEKGREKAPKPVIDYLAKDFDSFKHVLINAMRERVPGWEPTSEVDLDQVILDLLAADGDFLSDFQDRVMQERYWGLARKRVSLARHARLMDYHIHQGNQASTDLVLEVESEQTLQDGFGVWTGDDWKDPGAQIFVTAHAQWCHPWLNQIGFYTWNDALSALDAGATHADLALPVALNPGNAGEANQFRDVLRRDDVRFLIIEERLNPETGTVNGRDSGKRQKLTLLPGNAAAETRLDPFTGQHCVRVFWQPDDRLRRRYGLITRCEGTPVADVSVMHANVVHARHGRPHVTVFRPPGAILGGTDSSVLIHSDEAHWEASRWGTLCALPNRPLAYRDTLPGGDVPPVSSCRVEVAGFASPWQERIDLIESQNDDEHYLVETDELSRSQLRFGSGTNGRALNDEAVVTVHYQVGRGSVGNIGIDKLTGFDGPPWLISVRNPFDATNGRDPEPRDVLLRRVPVAYRAKQKRAVTLADYVARAEELAEVSHAYASYAWTGSWRTVRVAVDPLGTTELQDDVRRRIHRHLDAVRLIGEDLEVRLARYVPLDIKMRLCAHPDYWPEDLAAILEQEFSDDLTPDGRHGFFHPDDWTFGQPLHASQIIGRALAVTGVERVLSLSIHRWNQGFGPTTDTITLEPDDLPLSEVDVLEVEPSEVIQVANDPDHLERGRMVFDIQGGRR
ncbi:baseplate J/gp47 family protein [Litchfieldella qijiaojingensis]|nr:baseplate J/gp47 family protein [Halomonas qijiaojingensis]